MRDRDLEREQDIALIVDDAIDYLAKVKTNFGDSSDEGLLEELLVYVPDGPEFEGMEPGFVKRTFKGRLFFKHEDQDKPTNNIISNNNNKDIFYSQDFTDIMHRIVSSDSSDVKKEDVEDVVKYLDGLSADIQANKKWQEFWNNLKKTNPNIDDRLYNLLYTQALKALIYRVSITSQTVELQEKNYSKNIAKVGKIREVLAIVVGKTEFGKLKYPVYTPTIYNEEQIQGIAKRRQNEIDNGNRKIPKGNRKKISAERRARIAKINDKPARVGEQQPHPGGAPSLLSGVEGLPLPTNVQPEQPKEKKRWNKTGRIIGMVLGGLVVGVAVGVAIAFTGGIALLGIAGAIALTATGVIGGGLVGGRIGEEIGARIVPVPAPGVTIKQGGSSLNIISILKPEPDPLNSNLNLSGTNPIGSVSDVPGPDGTNPTGIKSTVTDLERVPFVAVSGDPEPVPFVEVPGSDQKGQHQRQEEGQYQSQEGQDRSQEDQHLSQEESQEENQDRDLSGPQKTDLEGTNLKGPR